MEWERLAPTLSTCIPALQKWTNLGVVKGIQRSCRFISQDTAYFGNTFWGLTNGRGQPSYGLMMIKGMTTVCVPYQTTSKWAIVSNCRWWLNTSQIHFTDFKVPERIKLWKLEIRLRLPRTSSYQLVFLGFIKHVKKLSQLTLLSWISVARLVYKSVYCTVLLKTEIQERCSSTSPHAHLPMFLQNHEQDACRTSFCQDQCVVFFLKGTFSCHETRYVDPKNQFMVKPKVVVYYHLCIYIHTYVPHGVSQKVHFIITPSNSTSKNTRTVVLIRANLFWSPVLMVVWAVWQYIFWHKRAFKSQPVTLVATVGSQR